MMTRRLERIVLASFFLSGTAALVYEISWLKLTGLYFEATAYAAATVVAIFMGGLALGSFLAGKLARRVSRVPRHGSVLSGDVTSDTRHETRDNPLLFIYFNIEALIGLLALLSPWLFTAARPLFGFFYRAFLGTPIPYHAARVILSALILMPAVTLMGVTLPLLVEALTREHSQLSRKSGLLYAINCLGAATGAFLAGFVLLPSLGMMGTILVGVAVNLVIAVGGWAVIGRYPWQGHRAPRSTKEIDGDSPSTDIENRHTTGHGEAGAAATVSRAQPERSEGGSPVPGKGTRPYIMAVFAASGFCSLNYEIIWTRILASNIGPASYSFATILCCFILGLALGSGIYASLAPRIRDKAFSCGVLMLLAALSAVGVTLFLPHLPHLAARLIDDSRASFFALSLAKYLLAGMVILPLTVFSGALFPAAAAAYVRDANHLSRHVGRLYAANSVASIVGRIRSPVTPA